MPTRLKTALFDVETNGLLDVMDTVHCLAIEEAESGKKFTYRNNLNTTQYFNVPSIDRRKQRVMLFSEHEAEPCTSLYRKGVGRFEVQPTYFPQTEGEIERDDPLRVYKCDQIKFVPDKGFTGKPGSVPYVKYSIKKKTYKSMRRAKFHKVMDNIKKGVKKLATASVIVGHNIASFDVNAIKLVYPDFKPQGTIIDTLVLCRMVFSDQVTDDISLINRGVLPAFLRGSHSLDSWGVRLGKHKGNYKAECKILGIDPWAYWNHAQEKYCENDVAVTSILWERLTEEMSDGWSSQCVWLEHQIHSLMKKVEDNGIPFDKEKAETLVNGMIQEKEHLIAKVKEDVGGFYLPVKKWIVRAPYVNEITMKQQYQSPRTHFGEDGSRHTWADVTVPKSDRAFKDPMRANTMEGAPFSKIVYKDFNPNSRDQIADRLVYHYDWTPVEFTETGRPSIAHEVLEGLGTELPIAKDLAEILFLGKRIGQIKTGDKAWLSHIKEDGRIHSYYNVGGTVSGRASHNNPNIGQVPAVELEDELDADGNKTGNEIIKYGRKGRYGYECRDCFYVPESWGKQMGADLKGLEARCLSEHTNPFDGGELEDLILRGDIHTHNLKACDLIPTRGHAKTILYAMMYGGGDLKLGTIVSPTKPNHERIMIGSQIRADLMVGLPGLAAANESIQEQADCGYLIGLDGRKLNVRKPFAALNLKLQSDGAIISKLWCVLYNQRMLKAGYKHSWDGDYAFMAWIHDEIQSAIRDGMQDEAESIIKQASLDAGDMLKYKIAIETDVKYAQTWAGAH